MYQLFCFFQHFLDLPIHALSTCCILRLDHFKLWCVAPQAESVSVEVMSNISLFLHNSFWDWLRLRLHWLAYQFQMCELIHFSFFPWTPQRSFSFQIVSPLTPQSSYSTWGFFPMDPSDNLFSFRFFPIHSSEEFDDPSGHHLFLVMGWFWRLCPALWKVQMLPLEKQRC